MEQIVLNKALNKEVKLYGLSYLGMAGAVAIGAALWLYFSMLFGIFGLAVGYGLSSVIARYWHSGSIQRVLYWHLPVSRLFGNKYLPESHKRCFM